MGAVLRREFSSFFKSPIGYVFLAAYYLSAGFLFYVTVASYTTQTSFIFYYLFYASCILLPILTMKLFSDEKKQKTDQLLLTSPVTLTSLVYGKFFATFFIYGIGVGITLVFSLILAAFNSVDWMVVIGNILGLLLIGAAIIAIGILISSLTESQIVAIILTLAVSLFLLMMDMLASAISSLMSLLGVTVSSDFANSISISQRYNDFTSGILDISNVIFFVSIVVVFNFITVRILEKRRWN